MIKGALWIIMWPKGHASYRLESAPGPGQAPQEFLIKRRPLMFPHLRNHRKLLSIVFALTLLLAPLYQAGAQKKQQTEKSEVPAVGDPISAALSLGTTLINSAT